MNSKMPVLALCIVSTCACVGAAFALLPAVAALLPAPVFLAGAGIGAGVGMIVAVVLASTQLQGERFTDIIDDELGVVAPSARAPVSTFFADLEPPARAPVSDEYQPSFDSVMAALADFEPTRGNALDRASTNGVAHSGEWEDESAVAPQLRSIAQDAERPLHRVAALSPFGAGTAGAGQPGTLSIEGADESTLGEMADVFGQEEDDRVLPPSNFDASASTPATASQSVSPLGRLSRASVASATSVGRSEARLADEQIDSVALFSEMFGSTDEGSIQPTPGHRGAATPRATVAHTSTDVRATADPRTPRASARPTPEPFNASIESRQPAPVDRAAPVDATPQRAGALAGLRSVRPSTTRPSVPASAMAAAAPLASVAQASTEDQSPSVTQPDFPRQPQTRRPTTEQRVITARLQMGMLRNHADDARSEFKKGQVPTPRKNAPGNLIMLSRRPEDFEDAATSEDEIRQLYREFVAALNRCGRSSEIVQYAAFAQRIQTQRRRVRAQFDGAPVNMVVRISEGRPKIVMRPAV